VKPIIQRELDDLQRQIDALRRASEALSRRIGSGLTVDVSDLSGSIASAIATLSASIPGVTHWNRQVLTANAVYTPTSGTTAILVRMVGGGAGGGGTSATGAGGTVCAGGGGSSGVFWEKFFQTLTSSTGSAVIGTGGAGGSTAGGNGSDGTATSFAINGTTYVALGGTGGAGMTTTSNSNKVAAGGGTGGVALSSAGDFRMQGPGARGEVQFDVGNTFAWIAGAGGSSPLGGGGAEQSSDGDGNDGTGYGGGGSGARASAVAHAGGDGYAGVVIIDEFGSSGSGGGGGGSGLTAVSHDATLSGAGTSGDPLSALPTFNSLRVGQTASLAAAYGSLQTGVTASIAGLSGTLNARFVDVSGSIDSAIQALGSTGISNGISNIWDKPVSASQWDDEFESTALDAAWSWTGNPGSQGNIDPYATFVGNLRYELHTDRRRSWLMMQPSTTSSGLTKAVPLPTNCFVWMRASFNARANTSPANNDSVIAIDLSANPWLSTDRLSCALNEQDAGIIQAEFLKTSGGVLTSIGTTEDLYGTALDAQSLAAVGIQRLGASNTYHGWAFTTGGSAVWLGSTTFTGSVATTTIGVLNAAATAPGNMIVGADFIRFVSSSVFLP
jgi:hypothetical protein